VWIAATVALVASLNTYQLSYAKGVIVEGFAMWTVVSFLFTVVLFVRKPRARALWVVAAALLVTLMTRPEWLYVPVPLVVFLLICAWRAGVLRRGLALHACAAIAVVYGLVGVYVFANGPKTSYGPFVVIPRIVSLGKVMQYRMQHDAPAKYADVTRRVDAYLAREGEQGPYLFIDQNPDLGVNYWEPAGEYAEATIRSAPLKYAWKTVKFAHTGTRYRWAFREIDLYGPFGHNLTRLEVVSSKVYEKYIYFPLFAAVCLLLWIGTVVKRIRASRSIEMMAVLAFLGLYQLFFVTAGGYADWPRLFSTLNPTRIIVIFGSSLAIVAVVARLVEASALPTLARRGELVWRAWLVTLAAIPLAFLASPWTADLGSLSWSTSAWVKIHPIRAIALVGICTWLTLVAHRARRAAVNGRAAASPRATSLKR
jgi:hypothetical protein